jgi:hypothetical protein
LRQLLATTIFLANQMNAPNSPNVQVTVKLAANKPQVTNVRPSTASLIAGLAVPAIANVIPANTTILSIDNPTALTLSQNAQAARAAQQLTFLGSTEFREDIRVCL